MVRLPWVVWRWDECAMHRVGVGTVPWVGWGRPDFAMGRGEGWWLA